MAYKIKPEIADPKYWLHLIIIVFVIFIGLWAITGTNMLSFKNVIISYVLLLVGDVLAHSLLKLD